ncbi:hypothetical protein PSACC_00181 [Paramicrosporidium saccamoebae]|uniref:Uncharacterized protein n=1 Tax=Paramicrosporidium saccamoebae TaxID=1246581 RepID=A0A2H9TQH1_9FUNG|nr:hypothetical protein PSACC_00181 [Paramicrosporidium saccamoebae]
MSILWKSHVRRVLRPSFISVLSYSTKSDPNTILRIGQNTEHLQKETRLFFDPRHTPLQIERLFQDEVELRIQNSPTDVLLSVHGEQMYRRVYRTLRWTLLLWYGLRHRKLTVEVRGSPNTAEPDILKLKWRVEGNYRWTGRQVTLLSGYSYYHFDATGQVKLHVVDRMVPPAVRGSWLWWYLDRLITPPAPKPLVNTAEPKQD